jgi:hypothetical protein
MPTALVDVTFTAAGVVRRSNRSDELSRGDVVAGFPIEQVGLPQMVAKRVSMIGKPASTIRKAAKTAEK